MTYEEKWQELKERLKGAELELLMKINAESTSLEEKKRLSSKAQGINIAQQYMRELDL